MSNGPDKISERGVAIAITLCSLGFAVAVVSIWFTPWPLWGKTLASGVALFVVGFIVGAATQP